MATPIEERILWAVHRKAKELAKQRGACRRCCHEAGFVATDALAGKMREPKFCGNCKRKAS